MHQSIYESTAISFVPFVWFRSGLQPSERLKVATMHAHQRYRRPRPELNCEQPCDGSVTTVAENEKERNDTIRSSPPFQSQYQDDRYLRLD